MVFDNWKTLETIWGGSLVITSLTNSISLFKPSLQESEGETKKESEPEETVPDDISANTSNTSSNDISKT